MPGHGRPGPASTEGRTPPKRVGQPSRVDRFGRRLTSFEQPAIVAAKAQINRRSGAPSGEDLAEAGTVFQESGTWPGTQRRVRDALAHGLQQRGDFELNLCALLGPAD